MPDEEERAIQKLLDRLVPPLHDSLELWKALSWQCAFLTNSSGPDEKMLMEQAGGGVHPSEVKRIKELIK
jgi:ribonucleotide monophosphatase NagD (HAD superfamily)